MKVCRRQQQGRLPKQASVVSVKNRHQPSIHVKSLIKSLNVRTGLAAAAAAQQSPVTESLLTALRFNEQGLVAVTVQVLYASFNPRSCEAQQDYSLWVVVQF